jgi:hypothetical protein
MSRLRRDRLDHVGTGVGEKVDSTTLLQVCVFDLNRGRFGSLYHTIATQTSINQRPEPVDLICHGILVAVNSFPFGMPRFLIFPPQRVLDVLPLILAHTRQLDRFQPSRDRVKLYVRQQSPSHPQTGRFRFPGPGFRLSR